MKNKIYKFIEKGSDGRRENKTFEFFIIGMILLSVLAIVLESMQEVKTKYSSILELFNVFSIIVFSIEYILRLYVSDKSHPSNSRIKSAFKFIFSTYGLIDLIAILPFYLPMVITMDFRYLRALRLTRFLRILKINRYTNSLNLIAEVIKEKKSELAATGFVTFLILLLASFTMYYIEGDKQPEQFPNILATFWWAVATLTTVGYGDVYPITGLGKLISGLIAIMGIGLVALPTGLISAGFMSKIENQKQNEKKTCPHCGKELENE